MRKIGKVAIAGVGMLAIGLVVGACASGSGGGGSASKAVDNGGVALEPAPAITSAATTVRTAGVTMEAPAAETAPAAAGGVETGAAEPAVPPFEASAIAAQIDQRIIQTAAITLSVPRGRFEETINAARSIAAGAGGFVTGSTSSVGYGERLVRGTLVVRVPQPAYARTVDQLTRLGTVRAQEESGEDVSQQFVDLDARARHLEAVETQLLEFLKRTRTVPEALAVQNRLDNVQLELEQVRGQLRYLDDQTSFATITLTVAERGAPVAAVQDKGGGWSLGDAWSAAASGIKKVLGGLLVAIVVAGPILAALALLFVAGRWIVRRRSAKPGAHPSGPAESPLS